MKKLTYIFVTLIVAFLSNCSAEKQLARIITKHPELVQDTIIRIDTFYVTEPMSDSISFTIDDLFALREAINDTLDTTNNSTQPALNRGLSVETSSSTANILANADGSFMLKIEQDKDTIYIHDSIPVKSYVTKTITKTKKVHKMNGFQKTFFYIGLVTVLLILISIIIKFLS